MEEPSEQLDELAHEVIGCGIEVHRELGPGFPESVYEESLCRELGNDELSFERQATMHVVYKGEPVGTCRADIIVCDRLILELKCVAELASVHRAQLYSYLRATDLRLGLLFNFNTELLKDGIQRVVNSQF